MQDEHSVRCIFAQIPTISIWAAVKLSRVSRIHGLCSTDTTPVGGPMFRPATRAATVIERRAQRRSLPACASISLEYRQHRPKRHRCQTIHHDPTSTVAMFQMMGVFAEFERGLPGMITVLAGGGLLGWRRRRRPVTMRFIAVARL
jgi:hypothetical protein